MDTKYQLILIGDNHSLKAQVVDVFKTRILELGLREDSILILNESNFLTEFKSNAPCVAVYFGKDTPDFPDVDILNSLISEAVLVLPVVDDLTQYLSMVPRELSAINGSQFRSVLDLDALVGSILEGFSLLRTSRRLFISYKRDDSSNAAKQLYEYLDSVGFDVFLDTHSIRPGERFQDELWHRLADTDIVVLLDTKDFRSSKWTTEELARASAMSIGILQLIWPNHKPKADSDLCIPKYLDENDFRDKNFLTKEAVLTEETLKTIGGEVESLRARSLAARQDNIIKEFMVSAKAHNIPAHLQKSRLITVSYKNKELAFIPTVGVPHGFTYNESKDLIDSINSAAVAYLLFDQRNIREKWLKHLDWLDSHLPVKGIKITDVDKFLETL